MARIKIDPPEISQSYVFTETVRVRLEKKQRVIACWNPHGTVAPGRTHRRRFRRRRDEVKTKMDMIMAVLRRSTVLVPSLGVPNYEASMMTGW
jgi:hypothetical protein